jgi:tRNA A-37 threonylcarbamoyl transferase component Bud32
MSQQLASHATDPLVGRVLSGHYRILAKLGEGAMARVYLAEHTGVGTNIVLKVLQPDYADRRDLVDRFLQEARIASEIHHDNIIDIFYTGRSPEGQVFLAMEYLPGLSLFDLLERDGALPWRRAQPILLQIASALAAAHALGVVHRDVKPENVLVVEQWDDGDGRPREFVKVVDFGIANVAGGPDAPQGVVGTPEYMPPEQARALPPDPRDDVYALGCLMYQVLTGDVPFTAPTVQQLLLKHLREHAPAPSARNPSAEIAPAVDEIVRRALEKTREARFQSMAEMLDALTSATEAGTGAAPERLTSEVASSEIAEGSRADRDEPARAKFVLPHAPEPPEVRRTLRRPVAFAAVLVLASSAFALWWHGPTPKPGRLEIAAVPADAAIFLDGQKLADRSPVIVDATPGRYTVVARRDGYETAMGTFEVRSAASVQAALTLVPSSAGGPRGAARAPAPAPATARSTRPSRHHHGR